MPRYKILISYDGTLYAGWQVQKNGIAIQPLIQKALMTIARAHVDLTGSGRTDAGVHALGQVAHFDLATSIEDFHRFLVSLNALLPIDIQALQIEQVEDSFHSRYSAKAKIYHYHLHLDRITNPFTRLYCAPILGSFSIEQLRAAIPFFLGTRDFTSFAHQAHLGSASRDPVRTLQRIDIIEQQGGIRLEFEGDGFLYKMVRNIVGTLCDVAQGRLEGTKIPKILDAKDRKKAGSCAPALGLFLMKVLYD
jgi:tRNA pseudouridine38-40 synthase